VLRLVEHHGGNLADVGVNGETEQEQLQHGNDEREEERAGIAHDVEKLLAANRDESAEEALHLESSMIL
jgi:hypothetical protein